MGKRVVLLPHLTRSALFAQYKATPDAATARRWHLLWLISTGETRDTAAALVGLSSRWASTVIARYNAVGVSGLADGRHANPGKSPLLTAGETAALAHALTRPPTDGGVWTGRKVAGWIHITTGKTTNAKRGIVYLRRLDYTLQVPRPCHVQVATAEEQATFRKA